LNSLSSNIAAFRKINILYKYSFPYLDKKALDKYFIITIIIYSCVAKNASGILSPLDGMK